MSTLLSSCLPRIANTPYVALISLQASSSQFCLYHLHINHHAQVPLPYLPSTIPRSGTHQVGETSLISQPPHHCTWPCRVFLVAKTPLSMYHGQSVHTPSIVMLSLIPLAFGSPAISICRNGLHRIASATSHPCNLVCLVSRRITILLVTWVLNFYTSLLFKLEPGLAQI